MGSVMLRFMGSECGGGTHMTSDTAAKPQIENRAMMYVSQQTLRIVMGCLKDENANDAPRMNHSEGGKLIIT